MADNKKIYTIQINGIDQSIKQVDALSDALQFLDKKIKEMESRSVSVTASNNGGGGNRTAELNTEDKLLKQIQNTEQQIRDARREDYQSLLAQKDILKDIVSEAQERAAAERLSSGNYGNTMKGLKQELSDIKSVMQTTDLGSDKFDELTKRAGEIINKLKELEQSYGQFGRNVGNYKSAFDGFDKINVNIGGVVKEFDNLKQAAKAIKDEMGALEFNGNKDTEMYKQLEVELDKVTKAQLRLNSAMNDAKSSSKAMDDLLDTLQSFGAMGQVTQGFSALFGIDNTEIERSIQKLVALQNVMQGIEKIRQQMNTQEGIGKIFAKGFDQIDAMNFKLKRVIVSINGTGTAAKAAAVGVNVLTTAAKALASIGIVAIISAAAYAIEKLVSWMSDWAKGNAELVSSEKMLKVAIDDVNSSLDKNIKLTQAKYDAGRITYQEKLIEEEKAYADALKASNAELKKRVELDSKNPDTKNNTFTQYASGKKNNADIYNDKGVTIFGGFTEAIKTDDELIKRYEALNEAVNKNTGLVYKNAKGYEIAHLSLDDCKDELNHLEQMLSGRMVNAMQQFDVSTKEGRKGLENFVTQILNSNSTLYKSLLLRLPEIVQENASGLKAGLSNWLTIVQQFVQNANDEMKKLDAEKWANSIIESADKTGKKLFQRQKEQADAMLEEGLLSKEKHDEVIAAINKNEKDKMKTFLDGEKRTADERRKKLEEAEDELNRIRIDAMREGLNKTIKQLEEEKRQRLNKIKANGQRVAELTKSTEALYYQKIEDARRDFADNMIKQEKKMWQEIGRISSDAAAKASENIVKSSENNIDKGIDRLQQKLKAIYSNYAPDFGNISDATLSVAGSIEGAIRNGDIKAPDGRTVNEETLKATQEYLNILQDIDEVEAQIYLQRRRMGASSNLVFDEKDLEGVNKVIDDSKALLERLKQMQSESSNLNIDEEINKLYGNKFEEYQKYIDDKIKAEKEAANKSFEIEKQRIKDETKLMEERYNDEKYQELNGLAATKGNEKDALDNKLKLQEISIKEYNKRIADLDAKYAELAKDKEVKYAEGAMAFADERNKKLEELEEKHRQTLLDIDHKYDGSVEEYRKEAFDEYVKYLEERKKEIEDIIRETNENIAKAEAARESIINSQSQDANEGEVDARIAALTNKLEELKKIKDAYLKDLQVSEEQMEESMVTTLLRNENYTSDLSKQFIARLGNHIKYYDEVEKLERNHYDTVLAEQKKSLASQAEADKTSAMNRLEEFEHNLENQEELELRSVQGEAEINKVREKYQKERDAAEVATIKYVEETTRQHNKDSERAEIEHQNNIKEIAARTQDSIISEYRDFYSKLANIQSSSPITNDWGIINLAKTKEQNEKLLQSYTYLANQIVNQKIELQAKLDANEISFDSFTQASRELNDLQTSVASSLSDIEKNMKESFGQFWGSINQWVQQVGQTMNTILSSLSEIQSNQYEEMIDQQEKYIEEYQKMLDKQKEITQEHASAVDSIEDELSTARGDRRQQLIDQLNAEMAAQRASLAQQKKIEKEKEKADHKKADLEYAQAVARKHMQESQALINAAMAVSMAAVNNWPIPAIPMMALAAAAGAAQYAAVKSQYIPKPSYGSGGVIQGKSHKEGGVPVLGGRAEVEGGEFITNKVTTSKNVDLLEYINTKRRKIKLEDLIDFYGGNSQVKKSITTVRTKFADGGMIPTLRNDINLSDRMLTAFEDYSNRPVQVAVVDIIDRTQQVNDVKVMAGLDV